MCKEIKVNDIIKIRSTSCVTKPLTSEQKQGSLINFVVENSQIVLVMRESVEVLYRDLPNKLGSPKEFKSSPELMAPIK
jgi:hypothetical protein